MCVAQSGGSTDPNNIANAGGMYQGAFSSTDASPFYMPPGSAPGASPVPTQPFGSGDFKSPAVAPTPAAAPAPAAAAPVTAVTPEPTPTTQIPPLVPRQPTTNEPQEPVARWGERYYRSKTARGEGSVARFGSAGGTYKSKLGSAAA